MNRLRLDFLVLNSEASYISVPISTITIGNLIELTDPDLIKIQLDLDNLNSDYSKCML